MEEQKSNAGQGLGIAGLVFGIMAIPMGVIPCTFYIGIVFGVVGIVLSIVALSQANRGHGPKALIIAALICSLIGFSFASLWGFALSKGGADVIKEIVRDRIHGDSHIKDIEDIPREILRDFENEEEDTVEQSQDNMQQMTDSLRSLEQE
jgi:hypothetical protein